MHSIALLIARILVAPLFLASAVAKLSQWSATSQRIADVAMPMPDVMLAGALVLEIVGAVLVLLGLFARVGAAMLLGFLIPVTLIMHAFGAVPDEAMQVEATQFMKNAAIAGGLLILATGGAGRFSLDSWRKRPANP